MSQITKQIKGAIYLDTEYTLQPLRYTFFEGEARSWAQYELVCEHTIEFLAMPPADEAAIAVKALEVKRAKMRAEFEASMTDIQHRINNLLALTYEEASQ